MQCGLENYDPKHHYRAIKYQRKADFDHCCAYCGDRPNFLTIDHVQPRSQEGTNEPNNLLPACKPCNESKGSKSIFTWYTPRNYRYTVVRWEKIKSILEIE